MATEIPRLESDAGRFERRLSIRSLIFLKMFVFSFQRDECKALERVAFIIPKFNFMAGQQGDWTAGTIVYILIAHAPATSDIIVLKT